MGSLVVTKRAVLCASAAMAAIMGASPVTSWAAETATTADAASSVAEIIVTAQRREQKLQDVGISVTVLGKDDIRNLGLTTATDITRAVPSLKMNAYSTSQVVFNIRGVSQNDYGDQQEPPVAVYQDDAYASSITTASFPIFDLARVEALRGPQGTLFGRNATGGAVQFISNQPTKDFEGYGSFTYGRYNQTIAEGGISGSLSDTVRARLSGIYDRDTGYIKSLVPGVPDRGANNHWALRGILAWEPNDQLKLRLTTRYSAANHERQAGLYSSEPACPNANFQGEFLSPTVTCGYSGAVLGGTPVPGSTATGFQNSAITPSRGGNPWATEETTDSFVDRKLFGTTLRIERKLAGFDIVSISDYQHMNKYYQEGGDASPDGGVFFYQGARVNQVSQELRVSRSFDRHQLVFGAFRMIINGNYTGKFATPFNGYNPTITFSQRTRSFAFFAQDEYRLTNKIKLIGGLRYWQDAKRASYYGSEPSSGVSVTFSPNLISFSEGGVVQPGTGITVTTANATPTFRGLTARAEIDFKPVDNLLLYASYNRGSKSGGFTLSTGTPVLGTEAAFLNGIPYKPEVLNAWEVGEKFTLNRSTSLNLDGFYYKYSNYQAFAQYGPVQNVVNLAAREYGLEAEVNAHPIRGLTLQVGASLLDSKVFNILLPDLATVVTHNLPQAPHASGNALARYQFPLVGGTGSVQWDILYSGAFCFTVLCAPVERERAYSVQNLRIGFVSLDKRWEIAGFIDNLTNHAYRSYAFDSSLFAGLVAGVYAKPRTWGLTATVHFGGSR